MARFGTSSIDADGGGGGNPLIGALLAIGAVVIVILLGGLLIGGCKSLDSTGPTEVAVVYNGGPFDSKGPREVVGASSGYKVPGLFSSWHKYIESSEQRYFAIGSDENADSSVAITVPTKDGVQVSIEGTTNFHTVFTGAGATDEECSAAGLESDCGDVALREFDQAFGNRTFDGEHVWSDDGWVNFLAVQFKPVLVSTVREEIGALECTDLISSCALIQQGSQGTNPNQIAEVATQDNTAAFQQVQESIQTKLIQRMDTALGGHYLDDFQVNIERVVLPGSIQGQIDQAQAAFAQISEQRANAEAARYEADRLAQLAEQYQNPGFAMVEAVKSAPAGSTIILGGNGQFAIPTAGGK